MIKIAVKLPAFVFPMRKSRREGGRFQTPPPCKIQICLNYKLKKPSDLYLSGKIFA